MPEETLEANETMYEVFVSAARAQDGRQLAISVSADKADTAVYVRYATGSDLQMWERRLVRQDLFALISRQRPDKCIARKNASNGSPLILVDISQISTNSLCLWRNEGNLRGFHPINCGVDWEQKINIPGNGPYRDGQTLITWEWSGARPNEMWMQLTGGYDIAAGADVEAVNTLAAAIYSGTYPKVFTGSIPVGQFEIDSVAYDIQRAPVFTLQPSALLADAYRNGFCGQLSAEDLAFAALDASKASFEGNFDAVSVTVKFKNQQKLGPVPGKVRASALAEVLADNSVAIRFITGHITIDGIPSKLLDELNKAFVPKLIDYLNQTVLSPIKIPAISFLGVSFSRPELVTQPGTLLAFSVLQPNPLIIPPPSRWPSGVAFVAADALALNETANAALALIKIGDKWDWKCDIGICDLRLEAKYHLRLGGANFKLKPGSGNRISGSVSFNGGASFQCACGIFDPTFGATITGSATVTASVEVRRNKVYVIFQSLDEIKVHIDLSGVPFWLKPITWALSELINAFSSVIAGAVSSSLRGIEFEVYAIPTIAFTIAGIGFEVTLKRLEVSTIVGPGSSPLLTVTGLADVHAPSYKLTVTRSILGAAFEPEAVATSA
jgi:hypothetical protein